jgi:hypothetical protein
MLISWPFFSVRLAARSRLNSLARNDIAFPISRGSMNARCRSCARLRTRMTNSKKTKLSIFEHVPETHTSFATSVVILYKYFCHEGRHIFIRQANARLVCSLPV